MKIFFNYIEKTSRVSLLMHRKSIVRLKTQNGEFVSWKQRAVEQDIDCKAFSVNREREEFPREKSFPKDISRSSIQSVVVHRCREWSLREYFWEFIDYMVSCITKNLKKYSVGLFSTKFFMCFLKIKQNFQISTYTIS